jgi:hypothetical protein
VSKSQEMDKFKFSDFFVGKQPQFEVSLGLGKPGGIPSRNNTSGVKPQKDSSKLDKSKTGSPKSKKDNGQGDKTLSAKKSSTPTTNNKKTPKEAKKPKQLANKH